MIIAVLMLLSAASAAAGGTLVDDFEDGLRWRFSNGPEFPGASGDLLVTPEAAHSGRNGAQLRFDFSGGGRYVAMYIDLPTDPPARTVTFWIRKPSANSMCVRVNDSAGQIFQKRFECQTRAWQKVRIGLTGGWQGWWGGKADGVFRGPPTSLGLLVESGGGALHGSVDIDEVYVSPEELSPTMIASEYTIADFAGWGLRSGNAADRYKDGVLVHGGGTAVVSAPSTTLLGSPQALQLHLSTDKGGTTVGMRLYSHFQAFWRTVGELDGPGGHVLSVPLGDMSGWEYAGGENDGRIHGGLRLGEVQFTRPDGAAPATTTLAQIRVQTLVPADSAVFGFAEGAGGDVARFSLHLRSLASQPLPSSVTYEIRTLSGRLVRRGRQAVTLKPGSEEKISISAAFAGRSCLEATFTCSSPGQKTATWTASAVRAGKPPRLRTGPESPIGMGLYMYRYSLSPQSRLEQRRVAEMGSAAGVRWSREQFDWGRIEPERGRFRWEFYDRLLDTADEFGISVYAILCYWAPWTKPYTEEGIDDFCTYARAVVRRYKDRVKQWEIWNEPNIFFWSGPQEMYAELLSRAYDAIKDVDPTAQVMGMSISCADFDFIRRMTGLGAKFDILTVHPYRRTLDAGPFIEELRRYRELARRADGSYRQVWITEMGWPTAAGMRSQRQQAGLLARTYLSAIASGAVRCISWYDFRDDGTDPFYNEYHFGVVRRNFEPKPAYLALANVARHMQGIQSAEVLQAPDGIFAARYRTAAGDVLAIWAEGADRIVSMAGIPPDAVARDMVGDAVSMPGAGRAGKTRLLGLVAGEPVLVAPVTGRVSISADAPSLCLEPDTARPGDTVTCTLRGLPPTARVSFEPPAGWESSQTGRTSLKLVVPPDAQAGTYRIRCLIELPDGNIRTGGVIHVPGDVLQVP